MLVTLKIADTNINITESLGESLRSRRKEMPLSMQRVADGSGLSVGHISPVGDVPVRHSTAC